MPEFCKMNFSLNIIDINKNKINYLFFPSANSSKVNNKIIFLLNYLLNLLNFKIFCKDSHDSSLYILLIYRTEILPPLLIKP